MLSLTFNVIALLEPLDAARGIHHAPFSGEERMAIAADFHAELFLGGTRGKSVAAGTDYFSIAIILGMNLLFHILQLL